MRQIDEGELEYDYDAYGVALLDGEPFTGEAVVKAGGNIVGLTTFVNGMEDGPKKTWYESGQIRSEGRVGFPSGAVGVWREWSESGLIVDERHFDDRGNFMAWRQWSESGELIKDESYDPLW